MKLLIIISAFVFTTCFAYQPVNKNYLQNKINLNVMYNNYPELREANIKLAPRFSKILQYKGFLYPAMYLIDTDTIFINKDVNPFIFSQAVLHEWGHKIYYSKLDHFGRKQWNKMFDEDPIYVSDCSKLNAEENFAEFVAIYYYEMNADGYKDVCKLGGTKQALFIKKLLR